MCGYFDVATVLPEDQSNHRLPAIALPGVSLCLTICCRTTTRANTCVLQETTPSWQKLVLNNISGKIETIGKNRKVKECFVGTLI
uniref:Uncharacterized protein n=1 Tax=Amphimedon queenslandica TaxID=400682 RepID=A0A1X7T0W0_AMPQE